MLMGCGAALSDEHPVQSSRTMMQSKANRYFKFFFIM
jgi:hypothetical protein